MKAKPENREDWRALMKRQLTLTFCGALSVLVTGATSKILASDLMRVEKEANETAAVVAAEVDVTEAVAWDSFDMMVRYYEDRVEAMEEKLQACEEGR